MPDQSLPKSRRYWLRFSVRGLMLLVLVVGAALGWVVREARMQRQAVVAIRAVGIAIFDWQYTKGFIDWSSRPPWPEWLVARVGDEYSGHVILVWVDLEYLPSDDYGRPPYDEENARMDAALAQIGNLSQIRFLTINHDSRARDALLAGLERLNRLEKLELKFTKITDLRFVRTMARLKTLDLQGSPVGDAALAHLGGLTRLRFLDLTRANITDAGLVHLRNLTGLTSLSLVDTKVTDAGLIYLNGLTRLSRLGLSHTKVTDAGLVHLKEITGLRWLELEGTQVTDTGVQSLKTALPNLMVLR